MNRFCLFTSHLLCNSVQCASLVRNTIKSILAMVIFLNPRDIFKVLSYLTLIKMVWKCVEGICLEIFTSLIYIMILWFSISHFSIILYLLPLFLWTCWSCSCSTEFHFQSSSHLISPKVCQSFSTLRHGDESQDSNLQPNFPKLYVHLLTRDLQPDNPKYNTISVICIKPNILSINNLLLYFKCFNSMFPLSVNVPAFHSAFNITKSESII